jgi:hypothetical protein
MTMGGTSGALYSLLLTMAGMALETKIEVVTARTWAVAWIAGTDGTLRYSQAKLGDRSMVRIMKFLLGTKFYLSYIILIAHYLNNLHKYIYIYIYIYVYSFRY